MRDQSDLININPADGDNPFGSPRNETSDGANNGTRVNEQYTADIWRNFQKNSQYSGDDPKQSCRE